MTQAALEMLDFIAASPTPFHCVAEARRRLEACGFSALDERGAWDLTPHASHYVERGGGSIIAFVVGEAPAWEGGCGVVGAHTDSPNLRLKPNKKWLQLPS